MTFSHLRPVEFAAAVLVSAVVLLVAIAPTLAAAPRPSGAAGLHAAESAGIECPLSPDGRLA
jgi:hypothetical protein